MSGRKIDDHSFWGGAKPKGSVLPEGAKMKEERSADGAGHLGAEYPDTTEAILKDQMKADSKVKSHAQKPGYRY